MLLINVASMNEEPIRPHTIAHVGDELHLKNH